MARLNDKRPLRSLVYVSDAQLGDIIDSLDTGTQRIIAAQLTIDFKLLGVTLSSTRRAITRYATAARWRGGAVNGRGAVPAAAQPDRGCLLRPHLD